MADIVAVPIVVVFPQSFFLKRVDRCTHHRCIHGAVRGVSKSGSLLECLARSFVFVSIAAACLLGSRRIVRVRIITLSFIRLIHWSRHKIMTIGERSGASIHPWG